MNAPYAQTHCPVDCVKMCNVRGSKLNSYTSSSLHGAKFEDVRAFFFHDPLQSLFQGLFVWGSIIVRIKVHDRFAGFQLNAPSSGSLQGLPFNRLLPLTFDGNPRTFEGSDSFQATWLRTTVFKKTTHLLTMNPVRLPLLLKLLEDEGQPRLFLLNFCVEPGGKVLHCS